VGEGGVQNPQSKPLASGEAGGVLSTVHVRGLEMRKLSVESQMMQFSHTQLKIFWAIKTVAHGVTNRFQVPEKSNSIKPVGACNLVDISTQLHHAIASLEETRTHSCSGGDQQQGLTDLQQKIACVPSYAIRRSRLMSGIWRLSQKPKMADGAQERHHFRPCLHYKRDFISGEASHHDYMTFGRIWTPIGSLLCSKRRLQ
jgi:hypothetical protein